MSEFNGLVRKLVKHATSFRTISLKDHFRVILVCRLLMSKLMVFICGEVKMQVKHLNKEMVCRKTRLDTETNATLKWPN